MIADAGDTTGYDDARESAAALERQVANAGDAVGNGVRAIFARRK